MSINFRPNHMKFIQLLKIYINNMYANFYSLHILGSKITFGIIGPLGKKLGVRLLYNIPDFEGHFDQYFALNSKTILDIKLIFFHF